MGNNRQTHHNKNNKNSFIENYIMQKNLTNTDVQNYIKLLIIARGIFSIFLVLSVALASNNILLWKNSSISVEILGLFHSAPESYSSRFNFMKAIILSILTLTIYAYFLCFNSIISFLREYDVENYRFTNQAIMYLNNIAKALVLLFIASFFSEFFFGFSDGISNYDYYGKILIEEERTDTGNINLFFLYAALFMKLMCNLIAHGTRLQEEVDATV